MTGGRLSGGMPQVPLGATGLTVSRLALGSANFGSDYGFSREKTQREVDSILDAAIGLGVTLVDTAPSYGNAEAKIGNFLAKRPGAPIDVATKTPKFTKEDSTHPRRLAALLKSGVEASLRATGRERVALLQLHQADPWLLESPALWEAVKDILDHGLVSSFGASVYEPEEGEAFLGAVGSRPAVVQAPLSLFDRRFSPFAARVGTGKDGVVVRSVFVRGAAAPGHSSAESDALQPYRAAVESATEAAGFSVGEGLLLYALAQPGVSSVLVGVESPQELELNVRSLGRAEAFSGLHAVLDALPIPPRELADPRRWVPPSAMKGE